jgi:hypothetical protein
MNIKLLIPSLLVTLVISCATSSRVSHATHETQGKGIPEIDEMIVELKGNYIRECYAPILKREVPETECQLDLFSMLERRYRTSFQPQHVKMASDDLFFSVVSKKIKRLVSSDIELRNQVKNNFDSYDDLVSYYRELYSFQTDSL